MTTYLDIGSNRLGYRKAGRGPDVVFVHGWPFQRETWRNVVKHMPDHTCHLIDLPGCGTSSTTKTTELSLRNHVDALIEAIEQLGLRDISLVGHDTGGLIARYAVIGLGDEVKDLVLSGTEIPYHHPGLISRLQLMTRMPGAVPIMSRLINRPRIARSGQFLGGSFWDRDLIEGDFRTEVLDATFKDKDAMRRQLEILGSFSKDLVDGLHEVHGQITCPTLLIWGKSDPFFPVGKARKMAAQFGGPTQFEVIDQARLMVHEEHPKMYASLCQDFFAK